MKVQVPAIMFSDRADAGRIPTALRLGAVDFFVRPVEDTEAPGQVHRALCAPAPYAA